MKNVTKSIALILIVLTLACVLCSCGKQLNAQYSGEYEDNSATVSFYGNTIEVFYIQYDEVLDTDYVTIHSGKYKIYSNSDKHDQLLIDINFRGMDTITRVFEEGTNAEGEEIIIIGGNKLVKTYQYDSDYAFKRILYNLGIIDSTD